MIKILVVDDEYFERDVLAQIIIDRFSYEAQIRMASNGRQAVDVATLWGADIILMDIEMPVINGIEAARRILDNRPECKIIFVTAYSLFSYAQEAVKLGCSDYILKPVDPKDVERAIRRAVAQAETQRQLKVMAPEIESLELTESEDKTAGLMGTVKKYLSHNYMLYDISLDSVSAILNINASYFSVIFKRAVGINFVDYLTNLRIQAAKELLADPLRSTSEVASMVGYESGNYFARAFKKKTGMTPTEFRRSCVKGGGEEP